MIVKALERHPRVSVFPGEGNEDLWFRGFYPWRYLDLDLAPLWQDPDGFVRAVMESRRDRFTDTRAQLAVYQWVRAPGDVLVNDNGMLAALLPDVMPVFPDARVIHVVRDGRVVSLVAARKTLAWIEADPARYQAVGCALDFAGIAESQARYWCWTLDRIQQVKMSFPGTVLEIRYEDWCLSPQTVLDQVVKFIGLRCSFNQPTLKESLRNRNAEELEGTPTGLLERIEHIQAAHLRRSGYDT